MRSNSATPLAAAVAQRLQQPSRMKQKQAWFWREPTVLQDSASAERYRGRIIVGMLTGDGEDTLDQPPSATTRGAKKQ